MVYVQNNIHFKRLLLIIGISVFSSIVYWVSTFSIMKVVVSDSTQGQDFTYKLTDTSNGTVTTFTSASVSSRRIVKKGTYAVEVSQATKSYIAIVNTRSFLQKTTVNAKLVAENYREFKATNPSPCVINDGTSTFSYACKSKVSSLKYHQNGTVTKPPSIKTVSGSDDQVIEGSLTLGNETYILIKEYILASDDGSTTASHTLYPLQNSLVLTDGVSLQGLSEDAVYSIYPFKNGFIVYTSSFDSIYYFSSLSESPKKFSNNTNVDMNKYQATGVTVSNRYIFTSFVPINTDFETKDTSKGSTIVTSLDEAGNITTANIAGTFPNISACANDILCLIGGKRVDIFSIDSLDKKPLFSLYEAVNAIPSTKEYIQLITSRGVLNINPKTREGYMSYSFGNYDYCGGFLDKSGYDLCITNTERSWLLNIDTSRSIVDEIDKQILKLQNSSIISAVSVFSTNIFITPNYGDRIYNNVQNIYEYSPSTVNDVNQQINELINSSGIDKTKYKVINTSN